MVPTDNITYHPQTGAEIVHPPADWLTTTRVETLLNFLHTGLAIVITYHSSRGQDMLVHDLRGGKHYVPHHMVTIKDLLRPLGRQHEESVHEGGSFVGISIGHGGLQGTRGQGREHHS